jgi:hypothetical protein
MLSILFHFSLICGQQVVLPDNFPGIESEGALMWANNPHRSEYQSSSRR